MNTVLKQMKINGTKKFLNVEKYCSKLTSAILHVKKTISANFEN